MRVKSVQTALVCLFLSVPTLVYAFHTSPECWKEPRMFHSGPVWKDLSPKIKLNRIAEPVPADATFSPNKAYAFWVKQSDAKHPRHSDIYIFTERKYVLSNSYDDIDGIDTPKWINEKLLTVRVWWGRIAATDVIIDVEAEKIIYSEMVEYGGIAYEQFKAQCRGICPCPSQ